MKFFEEKSPAYLHLKGLCDSLAEDQDFQEMRHSIDDFKKDTVANEQLKKLTAMGNLIRTKQSKKEPLAPQMVEEFETLRTEFLSNSVATAFVDSQDKLINVRKFVGHFIAKTIERGKTPDLKEIVAIFENGAHCGEC